MAKRVPGRLEHARKVLEKRASIAKLGDNLKQTRLRIVTAKAELKSLRGR